MKTPVFPIPIHKTLPISAFPLAVAGASHLLYKLDSYLSLLTNTLIKNQNEDGSPKSLEEDSSQNETASIILPQTMIFLQQFKTLMMSIYGNYLIFLMAMMILHIGVYHFKDIRTKKDQSQGKQQRTSVQPRILTFQQIFWLVLCYTLTFYLIKFPLAIFFTTSHPVSPVYRSTELPEITQPLRKFEEEAYGSEDFGSRMLVVQKPSFYKVINEVEIEEFFPLLMIFTNDFRTAFEVDDFQSLVAFDTSDMKAPKKLHTLQDVLSKSNIYPFGLVSPNGGLLLIDQESIQIINITDLQSLSRISQIQFRTEISLNQTEFRFHPSLAVSSNEKYLICSDPSLHIYDMSDLKKPKLLFEDESSETTTILLSADNRTMFLGSSGALKIFNVTDFWTPQLVSSFPVNGKVLTCAFSKDQKTLYIVSYLDENGGYKQTLSIINVTDILNPIGKNLISLGLTDNINRTALTLSPDETFLVLQSLSKVLVINLGNFKRVPFPRDQYDFQHIVLLPSGNNALIITAGIFGLAEIYLNIPYNQASSLQPNYIAQLPFKNSPLQILLHPSSERAFILTNLDRKVLLDINLKNSSAPSLSQTFNFNSVSKIFVLSSDGKNIYFKSHEKSLQVLSTEGGKLSEVKSLKFQTDFEQVFLVSSDKKTLFSLYKDAPFLTIYDISGSSPQSLSFLFLESEYTEDSFQYPSIYIKLSSDERTLFIFGFCFYRVDVSDPAAPVLQSRTSFRDFVAKTFVFTSDYKTCFALGNSLASSRNALLTINTTDFKNPQLLKRMSLPSNTNYLLSISSDDQFVFLSTEDTFLTYKIENRIQLKIFKYQTLRIFTFVPLQNTQNILICNPDGLHVISPKPKFALYTPEHQFKLGTVSPNPLKVLELNNDNNYASLQRNYKFIEASLCTPIIKPLQKFTLTFPVLPNWMSFDKENALLTIDLTSRVEITNYEIRSTVSTQIVSNDFLAIKEANYTQSDVENLQAYLIGQGYLDSEKYLTSSFDGNIPLVLDYRYSKFEARIREKLKSHLIEMLTTISVESSLILELVKPLQIITDSQNPISVTIKLIPKQAKFVTQKFPDVKDHLDDHKASLTLEGTLANVNEALELVLINVEKDGQSCEGNVIISDGLNPELIKRFDSVTNYFKINGQPKMQEEHSVQSQIDNSLVIIAGQYFNIDLNESTFIDPNGLPLTYSLEVNGKNAGLPGWITLRGQSLSGTPPEAFLPYTQTLVIRASNEYKSEPVAFTLKIRLAWMTIASRWLVIIGYFFTAFKTWQHSDKVYNVLGKKYYTYPVTLKIVPGQEISRNTIFPIALITEEVQDLSKIILTAIKQDLGQGSAYSDKQLIEYLTDIGGGDLNKQRLSEMIQDIVVQQSKARISQYYKGKGFNKNSVLQLIVNKLTMERIKFRQEKMTFSIFEKIKSKWIDLVDMNPDSDGFVIRDDSLAEELQAHKINLTSSGNQGDTTHEYSLDEKIAEDDTESLARKVPTKSSIEKELMISPGSGSKINVGLLKDAILAHAFDSQNLFTSKHDIKIQSNEKTETKSFIMKFLKFDLKSLVVHSTKRLGYGLKYGIIRNQIVFYGKFQEQFENKTMVIQILSKGGFILRELSIHGHINDVRSESIFIESIQDIL